MAVKLKVVKRKVLNGAVKDSVKNYAIAKTSGGSELNRLCKLICSRSTLSMDIIFFTLFVFVLSFFCSCVKKENKEQDKLTFDDCSIVAERVDLNGKELIDLDFSSIKDSFNIPLSFLVSSFDIIRLENKEEALTAAGQDTHIAVSDNYILIHSFKAGSSNKLYDRSGKYLRTLSSPGQGPDEYNLGLYDMWLDEKNDKAYLMSFMANKLLVFDLNGKPSNHIPLAYTTHKGRFVVNPENRSVTMMCLPFRGTPTALVWEQDFDGRIIQEYRGRK